MEENKTQQKLQLKRPSRRESPSNDNEIQCLRNHYCSIVCPLRVQRCSIFKRLEKSERIDRAFVLL